jgi:lysophospholipase L1-like esterase
MNSARSLLVVRFAAYLVAVAASACAVPTATAAAAVPGNSATLERDLGAEVERFVQADRAAPPAPCQVLFIGSSSIVKWRDTLAADMAPMPVINRGFGGSHVEHVNRWFEQLVAPYRPRAIVFYAGENDIDAGKSVDQVVADFDSFMVRKAQALGKVPVYFISVKPSKLRFAELPLQGQVNDAVRARAAARSDLHYIDVVLPMLEHGKPKDIFVSDGLHMNAAGYAIWTQVVRAALLPNTEAEARSCRLERGGV